MADGTTAAVRDHVLLPAQEMAKLGRSEQPVLIHAEGIYVYAEGGRRLIDGPAGMWCAQVGYGRREIVDAMNDLLKPRFTDAQKAVSGVVALVDYNGRLQFVEGLVRLEDQEQAVERYGRKLVTLDQAAT